ncbi:MAG: histone acetyltransferase, partial [Bacteroidetes bacterium]|nr:histone acetyltransferase [Bacteroidota bacterium]
RKNEIIFPDIPITTSYPETVEVNQIVSTEKEISRLRQVQKKFDHQLIGFFVESGKQVVVNLEIIKPSTDNTLPKIVIGTPSRAGNSRKEIALNAGLNTITPDMHTGGIIYFRYVSNSDNPQGKAKISFTAESQHVRAPHYIKGVTTSDEFLSMLGKYQTPDVMFSTDYAVVVVSRNAALNYSIDTDKEKWLSNIDKILFSEDQISGLSDDDPNPLHHRLAKGIRHLFAEASSGYMFATDWGTGYQGDAPLVRLLTDLTETNNWGVSHELGHQHQQGAYKPGTFTEVSVNIYTEAVQRAFNGSGYIRNSETIWNKLLNEYFTLPDESRNFFSSSIDPVAGSGNDSRLLLFEQLQIIFGDEFYHRLHRITREEQIGGGSDEERKFYFVQKSCQLTGYDLRSYFKKWGYSVLPYYQQVLDKTITESALQPPVCDISLTTPYSKPACLPLPLIGISTSAPPSDPQPADGAASVSKYCDYSNKTDELTDLRDGKVYPYKRFGNYDWFMKNLDWDGYDGANETSRGTVGIYGSGDTQGIVYGRMYPTNAASASYSTWCPSGWTVVTQTLWDDLITNIKSTYNLTDATLIPCLKCGGDRDDVSDGLWAKGAGSINALKAAEIGFNALPAGVFNIDNLTYDSGDEPGIKASFFIPNSTWFHKVITNADDIITYPNRNTKHHASIRCVRQSVEASNQNINNKLRSWIYIDNTSKELHIISSEPAIKLNVMDMNGRMIYFSDTMKNANQTIVNISNWNKGVYIVKTQGLQGVETYKAIVK